MSENNWKISLLHSRLLQKDNYHKYQFVIDRKITKNRTSLPCACVSRVKYMLQYMFQTKNYTLEKNARLLHNQI